MVLQLIEMIILKIIWIDGVYVQRFHTKGEGEKRRRDWFLLLGQFSLLALWASQRQWTQQGSYLFSHYPREKMETKQLATTGTQILTRDSSQGSWHRTTAAPEEQVPVGTRQRASGDREGKQGPTASRSGPCMAKPCFPPPSSVPSREGGCWAAPSSLSGWDFPPWEMWKNPQSQAPPCSELGL